MTTYQPREHANPPHGHVTRKTGSSSRPWNRERASWRTSTAPAALSVALLTGLAMAIALGFRELVRFAMTFLGG